MQIYGHNPYLQLFFPFFSTALPDKKKAGTEYVPPQKALYLRLGAARRQTGQKGPTYFTTRPKQLLIHVLRPFCHPVSPVPAGHRLPAHPRSRPARRGDRHGTPRQCREAAAGNPRPREKPVSPQLCPLRTHLDPGAVARGRKHDRRHAFRRRTRLLQHPHEGFCPCAQGLLLCGQDRRSPPPTRNRHVTAAEQPAGAARGG